MGYLRYVLWSLLTTSLDLSSFSFHHTSLVLGLIVCMGHAVSVALFILEYKKSHCDSMVVSFQWVGSGDQSCRSDLNSIQSIDFQTLVRGVGGGVKLKSSLMVLWSEWEGESRTLQFEHLVTSVGSTKLMSIIVADLMFVKVCLVPLFITMAPCSSSSSSRILPLLLSVVQPHSVL